MDTGATLSAAEALLAPGPAVALAAMPAAGSATPGRGLSGHLRLVCGLDSRGLSSLRRQDFRAPIHLSKPHLEDGTLVVNVVNPTAGLLDGDRIELDVEVETGARLLLTMPSASRVHRMRDGFARQEQRFKVAEGGFLEVWPEFFIPQAGARYLQRSRLDLATGAELFFVEMIAPGRVASGEVFAFEALRWETDVYLGGRQVARERYSLGANSAGVAALRRAFPTAYYASCFIASPALRMDSPCWETIHALHTADVWSGWSRLTGGGSESHAWVVKILARDSIHFRRALASVRTALYASLGRAETSLRRTSPVI